MIFLKNFISIKDKKRMSEVSLKNRETFTLSFFITRGIVIYNNYIINRQKMQIKSKVLFFYNTLKVKRVTQTHTSQTIQSIKDLVP